MDGVLWGGAVCGFARHSVVGGILLMSSRCERLGFHLNERHFLERLFNLRDGGVYFWIDEGIAFVKRDGVFVGTQAEIDKVLVSHKFKRAYFSSSDQVEETVEETTVRIVLTSSPPRHFLPFGEFSPFEKYNDHNIANIANFFVCMATRRSNELLYTPCSGGAIFKNKFITSGCPKPAFTHRVFFGDDKKLDKIIYFIECPKENALKLGNCLSVFLCDIYGGTVCFPSIETSAGVDVAPSNYIDSCGTSKNAKKNAKKRAARKKKKALSAHPDPPPYDESADPPAYSPSP